MTESSQIDLLSKTMAGNRHEFVPSILTRDAFASGTRAKLPRAEVISDKNRKAASLAARKRRSVQ